MEENLRNQPNKTTQQGHLLRSCWQHTVRSQCSAT